MADSSDVRVQGPLFLRIPNWLGDLVLAWPVVRAAAARDAIVAGPAAFEPLVLGRFPRAEYVPVSRARRYAAVGAIRKRRPGAALLLTDSLSSALLAWMARIPMRVASSRVTFNVPIVTSASVSYTHLTLPTNREV